jgi:predicted transcriptional regulator
LWGAGGSGGAGLVHLSTSQAYLGVLGWLAPAMGRWQWTCLLLALAAASHLLDLAVLIGPAILLFSRLEEEAVLSHGTRDRLFQTVRTRPGVSPQELVETHSASWSTVMYHLRVLERHGLVIAVRDGRHRRYFEAASGRWANGRKLAMAAMCNPTTAELARMVHAEPGIVQRRLATRLNLAPSSVSWHIRRLERVALVERQRDGHRVRLVPGPAWPSIAGEDAAQPQAVPEGVTAASA